MLKFMTLKRTRDGYRTNFAHQQKLKMIGHFQRFFDEEAESAIDFSINR